MSHDVTVTSKLMRGEEKELYGDSGYIGADKREDAIVRNKQNTGNPQSEQKLNTFSQLSREYSDIEKPDIEGYENRPPN